MRSLLDEPVGATLIRLATPMVFGISAIVLFNIVDTFWVGQLGALELAAMGFTFPVTMGINSLTIGVSIGASAVISRAIGAKEQRQVRRLTTDALLLAILIVMMVAALGFIFMDPLFRGLGADERTLPLIKDYMRPWFAGIALIVVPMVGNGAIRATGDSRSPAFIMVVSGLMNALFDPLLIFGWGPVPAMHLTGAAISTVLSYAFATAVALWILAKRERMITRAIVPLSAVLHSFGRILSIGLPAAATNLLNPLSNAALTRLVSEHGAHAVAAFGVGTRVEGLAMIGVIALNGAITPFVGQNFGAGQIERVAETRRFLLRAAFVWGVPVAGLLAVVAYPLASVFNDEAEVVSLTVSYMRIVPVSYAGFALALLTAAMFNALHVPLRATLVALVRLFGLAVPLAFVGSRLAGITGLFWGIAAANLLVGVLAVAMGRAHGKAVGYA